MNSGREAYRILMVSVSVSVSVAVSVVGWVVRGRAEKKEKRWGDGVVLVGCVGEVVLSLACVGAFWRFVVVAFWMLVVVALFGYQE